MRVIAVLAVALLLSGCTWMQQRFAPAPPPPPIARPEPKPVRPAPPPKPVPMQTTTTTPVVVPPPDYNARCREMATNRANDARQLGASAAEGTRVQNEVFKDCMAQSVKPTQ